MSRMGRRAYSEPVIPLLSAARCALLCRLPAMRSFSTLADGRHSPLPAALRAGYIFLDLPAAPTLGTRVRVSLRLSGIIPSGSLLLTPLFGALSPFLAQLSSSISVHTGRCRRYEFFVPTKKEAQTAP